MATNYGAPHMPKLVRGIQRSTVTMPGLSSAEIYMGGFVGFVDGADATPDGTEFGIAAWSDDTRLWGSVVGFKRNDSNVPIQDDANRAGTVTDATGELPMKYAFAATNSEENTTSADLEMVEIMPVLPGDIWEVSLWGASTASVARATTTAAGTSNSTDNVGVGLAVDTTYHFALLESGADMDLDDCDFITVSLDGKKPRRTHRVYVKCIRAFESYVTVE